MPRLKLGYVDENAAHASCMIATHKKNVFKSYNKELSTPRAQPLEERYPQGVPQCVK